LEEVVHKARNMTWEVCTMLKKTVERRHPREVQRWCPPTDEFLKVNIVGAFLIKHKSGGWVSLLEMLGGML
jgi:hypothetical protein